MLFLSAQIEMPNPNLTSKDCKPGTMWFVINETAQELGACRTKTGWSRQIQNMDWGLCIEQRLKPNDSSPDLELCAYDSSKDLRLNQSISNTISMRPYVSQKTNHTIVQSIVQETRVRVTKQLLK